MRVWIDLANSPHPLLFAPVARRLRADGHEVLLTARDHAQTVELARERWPEVEVIGGASPRGRISKLELISRRVGALRAWAHARRPQVALSHNSYAQIVAARSLQVPAVTAMDFEHQPVNHLAFRLAATILLPEMLALKPFERQGATPAKVVRYPGCKEELYAGDFEPDRSILERIGLSRRPRTLVLVRTPQTRALYHPSGNTLFDGALRTLGAREDLVCVALARHPEQVRALEAAGCLVPPHAIDARSLIYASDAVIGAGGTMTREAAVMGVPVWSVYAGATPAVDRWLEDRGLLARLTSTDQLAAIGPRPSEPVELERLRSRGEAIERVFVAATLTAAAARPRSVVPA